MKTTKTSLLILIVLSIIVVAFSCTPPPPPSPCSSVPVNKICFDDQVFDMNVRAWETWSVPSYKFWLDRESILGADGPYIYNQIILYNGGTTGVPEIGVYNMVNQHNPASTAKEMIIGTQIVDDATKLYYMDTTSVGYLEITSINGTNISGTVNCKLTDTPWSLGGSNSKSLKINFVDVPYQ